MIAKNVKSHVSIKLRMATKTRARCVVCKKFKSYSNPVEKCYECGNKFCLDHLWVGQMKGGMDENEAGRKVCDGCKESYGYQTI